MTLAKAKAKTNGTFIVQASLTVLTYDRQNMLIVQAIGVLVSGKSFQLDLMFKGPLSLTKGLPKWGALELDKY
jgi:hypothetical protein